MNEEWKDVNGFEGYYRISNYGNVFSLGKRNRRFGSINFRKGRPAKRKPPKLLKPVYEKRTGYKYVSLHAFDGENNITKRIRIHRLVAEHFLVPQESKPQVNHIDGNKNNNYVKNLEWCTPAENMQHAHDTGLIVIKNRVEGERQWNARLTNEKILNIRELRRQGKTLKKIGDLFGISFRTVWDIVNRRSWKHVP